MPKLNDNILNVVKTALGINGNYHDAILDVYIKEVAEFMSSAGVPDSLFMTDKVNGCIARGVSDLWNYGQGDATLSPYFNQRVIQLCREVVEDVPTE